MSLRVQLYEVCDYCQGTGTEKVQYDKQVSCHKCQGVGKTAIGEMIEPHPDHQGKLWLKLDTTAA